MHPSKKTIRVGVVIAAAAAPLAVLIILYLVDVPIGQPDFLIYRYSPLVPLRVVRGLVALGLGAVRGIAFWTDWRTVLSGPSVILAFGSALVIGALFGAYPAHRAATWHPVTALQAE